ncbi:hypothetical protein FPHOBKDP_00137 [Listeria phage LPJP1]|nr:hypothetical protein FPHOBKDP_00137 [Listeria phage LPJP1]
MHLDEESIRYAIKFTESLEKNDFEYGQTIREEIQNENNSSQIKNIMNMLNIKNPNTITVEEYLKIRRKIKFSGLIGFLAGLGGSVMFTSDIIINNDRLRDDPQNRGVANRNNRSKLSMLKSTLFALVSAFGSFALSVLYSKSVKKTSVANPSIVRSLLAINANDLRMVEKANNSVVTKSDLKYIRRIERILIREKRDLLKLQAYVIKKNK